jgi:hypothetical protein
MDFRPNAGIGGIALKQKIAVATYLLLIVRIKNGETPESSIPALRCPKEWRKLAALCFGYHT